MPLPLSFKLDNESIQFVLDRLSNNSKLSEWEQNFVQSIDFQFNNDKELSQKQLQKLSDIWEKY